MKAKTLLIAAATLAAGVMHSQAQVYSQNIVGYVNVPLVTGYNLVANQLDADGTGTNNSIYSAVGTNFPSGTQVLAWDPVSAGFTITRLLSSHKWNANTQVVTNSVNPGAGFFIQVAAPTNITFVGNVITGTNSYPVIAGYQIVSPSGPVSGTIDTTNGYVPTTGDQILVWDPVGQAYGIHRKLANSWNGGGDPQLTVGQSVFLDAVGSKTWTQVLNVQ